MHEWGKSDWDIGKKPRRVKIGVIKKLFSKPETKPVFDGRVGEFVEMTTNVYSPALIQDEITEIIRVMPAGTDVYIGNGEHAKSRVSGYMVKVSSSYRKDFPNGLFVEAKDIARVGEE